MTEHPDLPHSVVGHHRRFEEAGSIVEPIPIGQGASPELIAQVRNWIAGDPDPAARAELEQLIETAGRRSVTSLRVNVQAHTALSQLEHRFEADLSFGTAGLRGEMAAGPNRMNRAVVIRAAAGLGTHLRDELPDATPRVVVGYDARHHSRQFALDTVAVLTAQDIEALLLPSALPTPVLAFAVRHLDADAGVMVTASHNPAADNGYKVYLGGRVVPGTGRGAQIAPPHDAAIAARIAAVGPANEVPRADDGWRTLGEDVHRAYVDAVVRRSDGNASRDLRIVTTPLHGVGGATLAAVLAEVGFRHVVPVEEQAAPDPDFPTLRFPNPEEAGAIDLALAVAQDWGADLVLANDPDADRCAVAVLDPRTGTYRDRETAQSQGWFILTGDEVGALLGSSVARRVEREESDPGAFTLVSSLVSSRLLPRIAEAHGLRHTTTLTGFKWIARAEDMTFGYEEAIGYCVDPDVVLDKDGISAALAIAELAQRLKDDGRSLAGALDDLAREYGLYATAHVSARFKEPEHIDEIMGRLRAAQPTQLGAAAVTSAIDLASGWHGLPPTDGIVFEADDSTRVIVRPSGTEPKIKAYLEVVVPVPPDASLEVVTKCRQVGDDRLARIAADVRGLFGV